MIATLLGPPNSCLATLDTSGRTSITLSRTSATPRPCRAETGCGSPRPSDQRAAASASPLSSSTLLARSRTGFLLALSIFTTRSSVAVGPTVESTTNSTASASSTAISACIATDLSIPLASGSQPPVSTRVYLRPFHSALYETRSRVTPGLSSTTASRLPMILFTRADLPTFGLPTIASTGSAGSNTGWPSAVLSSSRTRMSSSSRSYSDSPTRSARTRASSSSVESEFKRSRNSGSTGSALKSWSSMFPT